MDIIGARRYAPTEEGVGGVGGRVTEDHEIKLTENVSKLEKLKPRLFNMDHSWKEVAIGHGFRPCVRMDILMALIRGENWC